MRGMWELRPVEEIRCIGSCSLSETLAPRGVQAEEPAHCRSFFLFSHGAHILPYLNLYIDNAGTMRLPSVLSLVLLASFSATSVTTLLWLRDCC